jgi:uncharacterized protein
VATFTADGLTFGVRVSDGLVAVTCGEDRAAAHRISRRLVRAEETSPVDPLAGVLDPAAETTSITLMVAQKCNLRCTYCYGGDGEYGAPGVLDQQTAMTVVSDFMRRDGSASRNINFFGGEPLMAMSTVRQVTQHAIKLATRYDLSVSFTMTTNATLVTEKIAAWLADHLFSLIVSIDGDPELQGRNRPDPVGHSSWDATVRGARHLLRFLGPERILARATLTSGYPKIDGILSNLKKIGFTRIALTVVEPSAVGSVGPWMESDYQRYEEGISAFVSKRYHAGEPQLSWNPLKDTIELLSSGTRRQRACGVGNTARAVSSDGHLYPCHRFVGDARFRLGSTASSRVDVDAIGAHTFEQTRKKAFEECQSCYAKSFCAGGCAHVAVQRMDSGLPPHDPRECDFIRWRTREAIRVFAALRPPPAPGTVELLGPEYLLRPASTSGFRAMLTSALPRTANAALLPSKLSGAACSAYSAAMRPLTNWLLELGGRGNGPGNLQDHDWLTIGLPLHLMDRGILPPQREEDAEAIGLGAAVVAHVQGLSRLMTGQESARLAWADAYTRLLALASRSWVWKPLTSLLPKLFRQHVSARVAERNWAGERRPPADWNDITGAKHCALVLPSMLLTEHYGLSRLGDQVGSFAAVAGPLRQYLDDYADVVEDEQSGKYNRWASELAGWMGEIPLSRWPGILGRSPVAHLVQGRIEAAARSLSAGVPWFGDAIQSYAAWLIPQIKTVSELWASRSGGIGELTFTNDLDGNAKPVTPLIQISA